MTVTKYLLDGALERPDLAIILCFGILAVFFIRSHTQQVKGKPLPRPKGYPILGNATQLGEMPWLQMEKWSKEFGPIFQLNLAGQSAVVLNNYRVAAELLDKRSGIYSDRPRMIMTSEILCGNHFFPFLRYGDTWRRFRKAAHEGLTPRAVESYTRFQERETPMLLEALAKEPQAWSGHLNRHVLVPLTTMHPAVASSTLGLCYAFPSIESYDDSVVTGMMNFIHRLEQAAKPGAFLVEMFPVMNHVPTWLAGWKRFGNACHAHDTEMFTKLYEEARLRSESGQSGACVSSLLFEKSDIDNKTAAWLAGTLFGAGSATTAAVHQVFVLAMVLHPHAMRKAQAEIDAVVGRNRLPNAGDRDKLTYTRALMREIIRWRSIGPLGVPHYLMEDDVFEGYHIPKNSIVFFNQWAMNNDREVYGDPEIFRPERFLDENEEREVIPPNTHGEGHTLFGYGRRRCPGFAVANNTILLNIATILWAFNIEKGRDAEGNLVTPNPDDQIDEGLVVLPVPFPASFVIRDPLNFSEVVTQARLDTAAAAERD
ncbi:cytochrome P450 [Cristinia sonorae]|uniref:Cytochrome P450 n=1 Tax=Cristinia sonorae TaxID=1940300 RepID=A0A8K0UHE0_9AGAR|nr:cytochrome P450 [Cristinia sonorae]